MEQLQSEQTQVQTQPVETEENEGVESKAVSLGKFKDVNALLSAYNSLESEFTKRCQKIKQLESALSLADKQTPNKDSSTEQTKPEKDITEVEKERILKEYLSGVLSRKQTAIVMDGEGVGVKTPVAKPKTITDAGKIAKELFTAKQIN